ncbi:hypothetical protein BH09PSE4_BH09PSE4_04470 [soil metagenome]
MGGQHPLNGTIRDEMLDLLSASVSYGTGRQAGLSVDTYGKTGTTQDNRDALFMGFAGGLVCGVWVGNDDNTPNPGLSGGGIPARVWRDFMQAALNVGAREAPEADVEEVDPDAGIDNIVDPDAPALGFEGNVSGFGLNMRVGRDGSIEVTRPEDDENQPPPRRETRDRRVEIPADEQ